jgi:hypothetical protein
MGHGSRPKRPLVSFIVDFCWLISQLARMLSFVAAPRTDFRVERAQVYAEVIARAPSCRRDTFAARH